MPPHAASSHPAVARPGVQALRTSLIREVANAGMQDPQVLPFWVGESDQPTPAFIREAAARALADGRTFYTHNLGRADLRETLSSYLSDLHDTPIGFDRMAVTSAGVNALMVTAQAIVEPGDRVCLVTPVWPNVQEIPRILGAQMAPVSLELRNGRWSLDLDRLMDALTPDTRAVFINSPNNPTGWTLDAEARAAILERCRRYGIWLLADDVYERLVFSSAKSAPSFLPLADPEDRLISTNSFSKAWRMTGWRLGWMVVPPSLVANLGTLLEYNTSCAPDFVQSAAITAITDGEPHVAALRAELNAARDQVLAGLRALPGIEAPEPDGGMYSFFRIEGCTDSLALAKTLVAEAKLGAAPGAAFGDEGEGWLRWCFAQRPEKNAEGLARLAAWIGR